MPHQQAGMTYLTLKPDSRFYVLHVDGVGDYGMTSDSGLHCLFLFTSKHAISGFVDRMEMPDHKAFTAIDFDLRQVADLLSDTAGIVHSIAFDPESDCDFTPVSRADFLRAVGSAPSG